MRIMRCIARVDGYRHIIGISQLLPSGKPTHSHGKSPSFNR